MTTRRMVFIVKSAKRGSPTIDGTASFGIEYRRGENST
jgi:hypothetical protein